MKLKYFALIVFQAAVPALAQPVCEPTVSGELRIERFESKTFGTSVTVRVWLPETKLKREVATRIFPISFCKIPILLAPSGESDSPT